MTRIEELQQLLNDEISRENERFIKLNSLAIEEKQAATSQRDTMVEKLNKMQDESRLLMEQESFDYHFEEAPAYIKELIMNLQESVKESRQLLVYKEKEFEYFKEEIEERSDAMNRDFNKTIAKLKMKNEIDNETSSFLATGSAVSIALFLGVVIYLLYKFSH